MVEKRKRVKITFFLRSEGIRVCQHDDGENPILIKNYDVACREENYWRWIPVALK